MTRLSPRLLTILDALPLRAGARVLEIGCGPGALARDRAAHRRRTRVRHRPVRERNRRGKSCVTRGDRLGRDEPAADRHRGFRIEAKRGALRSRRGGSRRCVGWASSRPRTGSPSSHRRGAVASRTLLHRRRRSATRASCAAKGESSSQPYSARSAVSGSTFVARRAGIAAAAIDTTTNTMATPTKVEGSSGVRPKSMPRT